MDINSILDTLQANSLLIIFIVMYLEALNLTGIPALVIMPGIGIYIAQSNKSFSLVFFIALLASILGSLTYYFVSYKFGKVIYNFFYNKFPSTQKPLKKSLDLGEKYGSKACLIGRIIPGARTFVSLMAGVFKIKFKDYLIYSSLGIAIWDFTLIFLAYILSLGI